MTHVAVVANRRKELGGGLPALRAALARAGVDDPVWLEAKRGRAVPRAVQRAAESEPDVLLVWGGDGTVQRAINAAAGFDVAVGIIPAGSANLLARNLGIPADIAGAVDTALHGVDRHIDTISANGIRCAVMCGAGADATLMEEADDADRKGNLGVLAYLAGARAGLGADPFTARVEVDGVAWFEGAATTVLVGNVGDLVAGLRIFRDARPDDGVLDVAVMRGTGAAGWLRTALHAARGSASSAPQVETTRGQAVTIVLDRKAPWEADGGVRGTTRRLTARIDPASLRVRVPR